MSKPGSLSHSQSPRPLTAMVLALVLAFVGVSCTRGQQSSPAPTATASGAVVQGQGKVLRVRAFGDPVTLDWNRATTWVEDFIIDNLMDGLVETDARNNPMPALAREWKISPDQKTYTFFLRPGVKWSDGVELSAQHFVDSWERLLSPKTKARYASLLFDIDHAEAYHDGKVTDFTRVGIRAIDELTLEVRLKAPISFWYWIPGYIAVYPIRKDLIAADPENWAAPGRLVSVGPYVLVAHEPGKKILLRKNPYFWGPRGNVDEVLISVVYDDSAALKLYEAGEIDFLPKLSSLERERLVKAGRSDLKTWPDLRVVHLRLNTNRNPTAQPGLRRAIAMAVDRSKLSKLFSGFYEPAAAFTPTGVLGHEPNAGLRFDPNKAKAELKSAGLDAAKLPPLDLLTVAFDDQILLAQFIQEELKRNLGLSTRIHIYEPKRYYGPNLPHNDFAMQINFWGADYPDADSFYSIFLGNSGLNRYHWKNTEYDRLITNARSLSGPSREKAYADAQRLLLEQDVATIPMYYTRISGLVRSNIQGFDPGPLNWWSFRGLSIQ